jgi:GTP-binding protein
MTETDDSPASVHVPLIAIVGRPNVGKSALFNRLTRTRRALVEDLPGTTRDRNYGDLEWRGRRLRVVDTGGLLGDEPEELAPFIREAVEQAIAEADVIVLTVDGVDGATQPDHEIARLLRRASQPVVVAANKCDVGRSQERLPELYGLGLGDPHAVSAIHGTGVAELLDVVLELVDAPFVEEEVEEVARPLRIAIVGRPNVGKSSLVNAILGERRTVVSTIPGTTRDAVDTPFTFEGHEMVLVDTAGIRRRGRVERGVERHSVQRAERAIDRADVVFLLVDQGEPLTAQDTHIAGQAQESALGLVIVVNKWDLAEDRSERPNVARQLDQRYKFVPWAPVMFSSTVTNEGVRDLLELAVHIAEVRTRRVQTSELNRVVQRAMSQHGPPTIRHRKLKVLYATQAEVSPPTFVLFVNDPTLVHFSYQRYLENQLREAFDFEGTGIKLVFRKRAEARAEVSA